MIDSYRFHRNHMEFHKSIKEEIFACGVTIRTEVYDSFHPTIQQVQNSGENLEKFVYLPRVFTVLAKSPAAEI